MLLLKQLDREDESKVRQYRLQVKARLYRFNYVGIAHGQMLTPLGNALDNDIR
jgi:hypothetical protein